MKRKKWIYIVLIIILVVPILFFYNAFNGNPIWKMASESALKDYLKETYPDQEFNIDEGFYNFKFSEYSFKVNKIGVEDQKKYEINVRGFFKPTVAFDEIYMDNLDEPLMEKLGNEAAAELQTVFKDVNSIVTINVRIEVLKGTYDTSINWSKDLKIEKPIYIDILMDAGNMPREQLLEEMKKMQSHLNTEGYTYDNVNINANLFDGKYGKDDQGYVKYASSFTKDKKLSLKDIEEYNQ